jgi:MoaA/NifB/PqqE/SkfB family radical SAM enzyme
MAVERLSIELTNRCQKGCWFCYNHSGPTGATQWSIDEVVSFVSDCAHHGIRAVSFGGGEPLQFDGLWNVVRELQGRVFRSLTTNGLLLDQQIDRLIEAAPDKVHISIHFPNNQDEVVRVIAQVRELAARGVRSGINLLVPRSRLAAAERAAEQIRDAGITNERMVFLPMRGRDTPTAKEIFQVAGSRPFQSMSCLGKCARSPRFCSVGWDKSVAWCSYTEARAPLSPISYQGLMGALTDLGLKFCGGTDE